MSSVHTARRALSMLDLTNLDDQCGESDVDLLCHRASENNVAAVCVWPQFVERCTRRLAQSTVRVATVVNFPQGNADIGAALVQTRGAILDGTDEVDLVMPYLAWLTGEPRHARDLISAVKGLCGPDILLKVILETGCLRLRERIVEASRDAIASGADFLKTSTGKTAVSATPGAAETMLEVIRGADRPVGFKAAGGIRTVRQAAGYLRLADRIMGPAWATPRTFRFGASSLLDALRAVSGEKQRAC